MTAVAEPHQRRQITGDVDDLGRCRSAEEVEAEEAHEQEQQEAAGAGSEEAVIKTDGGADADRPIALGHPAVQRRVHRAEVFLHEGVDGDRDQHERQQRADEVGRHPRHGPGADEGQGKRGDGGRRRGAPRNPHAARVTGGGRAGTEYRCEFIGAEDGCRRFFGQQGEHGGELDQAAAADNGVDQAGGEGGAAEPDYIDHGRLSGEAQSQYCTASKPY